MKGTEAAKIIKNKYPLIKVIILTGFLNYADSLKKDKLLEAVFKKPFSLQELADKLSLIINAKQPATADLQQKGKIQARVLNIKAKLLFIEPSSEVYRLLEDYFNKFSQQGKDYELDVAGDEESVEEKLTSFGPDLFVANAAGTIITKVMEKNLSSKEIIIYNIPDIKKLQNTELEKLAKSIEDFCLKNGLIENKWVEI